MLHAIRALLLGPAPITHLLLLSRGMIARPPRPNPAHVPRAIRVQPLGLAPTIHLPLLSRGTIAHPRQPKHVLYRAVLVDLARGVRLLPLSRAAITRLWQPSRDLNVRTLSRVARVRVVLLLQMMPLSVTSLTFPAADPNAIARLRRGNNPPRYRARLSSLVHLRATFRLAIVPRQGRRKATVHPYRLSNARSLGRVHLRARSKVIRVSRTVPWTPIAHCHPLTPRPPSTPARDPCRPSSKDPQRPVRATRRMIARVLLKVALTFTPLSACLLVKSLLAAVLECLRPSRRVLRLRPPPPPPLRLAPARTKWMMGRHTSPMPRIDNLPKFSPIVRMQSYKSTLPKCSGIPSGLKCTLPSRSSL